MLCPRPAAAQNGSGSGSWTFSSTIDSENALPGTGPSTLSGYKSIEIGPDGTASVNIAPQGQARIVALWSPPPYPPGATPPKTVTVRFKSWIEAWASEGTTYYQSSSGERFPQTVTLSDVKFDNGFGDPVVVLSDSQGNGYDLGGKRWQVEGLHLKTFSTEGISPPDATRSTWKLVLPATKVSATITAKASGFTHSAGVTVGNIFARIYGLSEVTGDSRSVQINSPSFFDAQGKNWQRYNYSGIPSDVGREENKRQGDGSMTVDSAVVWNPNCQDGNAHWQGNESQFVSNDLNFINPKRQWLVTGGSQGSTTGVDADKQFRATFWNLGSDVAGADLANSSYVWLKVTDAPNSGDGAVGTNVFAIRWHLPVEWNKTPYKTLKTVWHNADPVQITMDHATGTGDVQGKWQYSDYYKGPLVDVGQTIINMASASPEPWSALFFTTLGMAWPNYVHVDTDPQSGNFQAVWSIKNDTNLNTTGAMPYWSQQPADDTLDTQSNYRLTNPRMAVEYLPKLYNGDAYNTYGYEGPTSGGFAYKTGKALVTGDFIYQGASSTPSE